MRYLIFLFALLPGLALAQDWAVLSGDEVLTRADVLVLTESTTLVFFDDGRSKFSAGGAYSYTYANGGGTAFGTYTVDEDGTVCIEYHNGRARCDRYVRARGRVVLLTEKGDRFPVRP